MLYIRKDKMRGTTKLDWLDSLHTFSFADYYDPQFMGYSVLRVINEDTVQPSGGFAKHPHHDMEIITYVIEGAIEHQDSIGNGSIIRSGEIQRMSAGTGIKHSEFNPSKKDLLRLLQIWIIPNKMNLQPSYEQKNISDLKNQLILIGSPEGSDSAVKIHQNVKLYLGKFAKDHSANYSLADDRVAWVQLVKGKIEINQNLLEQGDAAAVTAGTNLDIKAHSDDVEFLLFDLPDKLN